MAMSVNSGARLDELPIGAFHRRLLVLIGAGMFLDGFEIYLAGGVVGALVRTGWSDLAGGAEFISAGVFGMVLGAWMAGVLGDRFGRRFTYQLNLLVFGLASFAAAVAPSMWSLIGARFVMGIGLGAEVVVGYATLIEYVPPGHRGRWGAGLSAFLNSAVFASALAGYFVLPTIGWRWLFAAVGAAAMVIWYLRKAVPESPRWLESKGRTDEAEQVVAGIEREAGDLPVRRRQFAARPATRPVPEFGSAGMVARLTVGCALNIGVNVAVYGFVVWLPTFFIKQGFGMTASLGLTTIMSLGGPVGAGVGMLVADRYDRRWVIVAVSVLAAALGAAYPFVSVQGLVLPIGFTLMTAVYVLVAVAWASYVPELFPTELRLRATGICAVVGRLSAIGLPYAVVGLFDRFGLAGVTGLVCCVLLAQAAIVAVVGIGTNAQSLEALAPDIGRGGNVLRAVR